MCTYENTYVIGRTYILRALLMNVHFTYEFKKKKEDIGTYIDCIINSLIINVNASRSGGKNNKQYYIHTYIQKYLGTHQHRA